MSSTRGRVDKINDSHALVQLVKGECSPLIDNVAAGVCSDQQSLEILRKSLNIAESAPSAIIKVAKAKTDCSSESCLYTKVSSLDKALLNQRFKPQGPWKTTQWLSNTDIDDVLTQWGKHFPGYKHIEFQMRDFEKQGGPLAKQDWGNLLKKYDSVGCVLNTDMSSGSGEHWTAFFVDFAGGTVEYFDSAGQEPLTEFSEFAIKVAHELSKYGKPFRDVMVNKVEHQKENTECGVYSIYYILSRMHGIKISAFEYKRIPDDMMVAMRANLFRNS